MSHLSSTFCAHVLPTSCSCAHISSATKVLGETAISVMFHVGHHTGGCNAAAACTCKRLIYQMHCLPDAENID